MSVALIHIGDSHVGDRKGTPAAGDAVVLEGDRIAWIGRSEDVSPGDHETVIDARGCMLIPGLIDSHVHVTFGDYTPRQQTVGFLESYLHGGTTRVISARIEIAISAGVRAPIAKPTGPCKRARSASPTPAVRSRESLAR